MYIMIENITKMLYNYFKTLWKVVYTEKKRYVQNYRNNNNIINPQLYYNFLIYIIKYFIFIYSVLTYSIISRNHRINIIFYNDTHLKIWWPSIIIIIFSIYLNKK